MAKITSKAQFNSAIKGIKKNATVIRNDMQDCIVFGLDQYETHGNISFLSRCRQACITSKALPANAVQDYIERHANVTYNGKAFKSKNTKDRRVKALEGKWFDSINTEETPAAPKPTDVLKLAKAFVKSIETKQAKDLLNDDDAKVKKAHGMAVELVARMEEAGFVVSK